MKKIIISDYDKTLYTNDNDMLININRINKFREQENLFVIATGRSYLDLDRKLKEFPIAFDYLILSHGTVILDKDKNIIKIFTIDNSVMYTILDNLSNVQGIKRNILFNAYESDVSIDSDNLTKLMIEVDSPIIGEEISKLINTNFKDVKSYVISTHKYTLVEVISINTDKGEAIEELLKIENIENSEVYTIGDGSNDIEMIKKYNGYGMTNSEQCVLEVTNKLYDNVYNLIDDII